VAGVNRNELVRSLPCIACQLEGCEQLMPTEAHHLNLGGLAGQKRRGDEFTIPLCTWHHRSVPPEGMKAGDAAYYMGPSLAQNSKLFRLTYRTDDELLELTNQRLGLSKQRTA
jgi:hypothetical protein